MKSRSQARAEASSDGSQQQQEPSTAAVGAAPLPPAADEAPPPAGNRPSSPWHALDVQSVDNGRTPLHKQADGGSLAPESATESVALLPARAAVLPGSLSPQEKIYMTALFTATAALLYADQNLLAPNLTAIAEDFGFDDQQRDRLLGGFIAAAFFGVGAPAALLFGWLSDRVNRCRLLFAAVMLGAPVDVEPACISLDVHCIGCPLPQARPLPF